ncbi:MAG: polysaccharide deacetylase family protein [Verrucomicrobiales bacterium]
MQAIKDARLSVISMDDFLAWRREEKNIPSPAILITIDDGWESTYTKAFPILKEYGFPFTLFLYKNYVNIGGKSLDSGQIEEMRKAGATVESHSVSHPLPSKIRNRGSRTPEEFDAFLLSELADSKAFLQQNFGVPIRAFAFPGGVYSDRLIELNDENKIYQAMFTCNPAKVNWETPSGKINRYIIHGNNDQNFGLATNFRGGVGTGMGKVLTSEPGEDGAAEPLYKVSPEDGASIADRLPEITVDLSKLEGVIPASIEMQISGFGQVIPTFDPGTGIVSYQVRERLRLPEYQVVLQLRRTGEEKADAIAWRFTVDQSSFYLPADYRGGDGDEEAGGAEAVPPAVGAGSAGDAIPN